MSTNFSLAITRTYTGSYDSSLNVTFSPANTTTSGTPLTCTYTANTNSTAAPILTISPVSGDDINDFCTCYQSVNPMTNMQIPGPDPVTGINYLWNYFMIGDGLPGIYSFNINTTIPVYVTILGASGKPGNFYTTGDAIGMIPTMPGGGSSGTVNSFEISQISTNTPIKFNITLNGYDNDSLIQTYNTSNYNSPLAYPGNNAQGSYKVAAGHQGSNAEYSNSGNGGNGVDTYDTSTSTPVTISGGTISQWYTIPSSGGGGGSGLSPNANWLEESYDAGTSGNAGTNTTFPNLAPFPYASQGRAGTKNSAINCNDSIMPDSCSQGSYLPSSTSGAPGKLSVCCYDNTQKLTYGGFGGGGIYKNPYWLTGNDPLILIYYQTSIS